MLRYKQATLRHFDSQGIKYTDIDERAVRVSYNGDNMDSIDIIVIFDNDDTNYVTFKCWSIGKFNDSNYSRGLLVCNDMNNHYRWAKFYLDSDKEVTVECDAILEMSTCGAEVLELVRRLVNITDESYPNFMKVRWN